MFLGLINLITSPNTLWVIWPALGMGIALLSEVLGISSSKKVS
nr:2TM domain-containing protein [Pseudoalteromonas sp. LC2018020214]